MIDPRAPEFGDTPVAATRPRGRFAPSDPEAPPAVSVVTPFYRPGALFHETARSLFAQSLQQWEWWIVNDASPDRDSLAVLEAYRDLDPRVRVLDHPTNRGLPAARNTGIAAARADYVYLLDDDDLLEATALEKTLWHLHVHPEHAFANGWSVGFGAETYLWQRGFEDGDGFLERNGVSGRALVRRRVWEDVGGYDESLVDGFEDWDFWLRCAARGHWGATLPEYLDWYRRRADHGDRWRNLEGPGRHEAFARRLREGLPRLFAEGVPVPESPARTALSEDLPCANELAPAPQRLLMLVPWLTLGGADAFNLDALAQLTARGWSVTIAATREGDSTWAPAFARHTPDVFVLPNLLPPGDRPAFLRYLIASRRPDVVLVTHSELGYQLLPYLRSHAPGPCYVDLCHMEEEGWKDGGYPRYAAALRECLDLSLVTSRHLAGWMAARGSEPERIEVVTTNVDTDAWQPDADARAELRRRWDVPEEEPLLLFAGRLCVQKQPGVLAGTLLELARRGAPFRALVAGDGEERRDLEARLAALPGRARLLGALPRDGVRALMSAADVFFLPSRWEGIALSLYEAMAMGLAVVSGDVGGQSELVTPDCGVLVDAADTGDPLAWADALEPLLRDPARRRAFGAAARRRVCEGFRLDQMADTLVAAFERAVALASDEPRPALPVSLAREWAVQATERERVESELGWLWEERGRLLERITDLEAGNADLERGRAWLASQFEAFRKVADDRGRTIEALRSWSEHQDRSRAELASQREQAHQLVAERGRTIEALRAWADSQSAGKAWLEEQRARYQRLADEHARTIAELRGWIDSLARGKSWLESQRRAWQRTALEREQIIEEQQGWIRDLEAGKRWLEDQLLRLEDPEPTR